LFAFLLLLPSEASSQVAAQNSGTADTSRRSVLKLEDNSGIPWETKKKACFSITLQTLNHQLFTIP
jgi:hypothetical protein